jgi:CHAD domain-containing protein
VDEEALIVLSEVVFSLPDGCTPARALSELAESFSTVIHPTVTEHRDYFDTFDWRLFVKSLVLYRTGGQLVLRKLHDNGILATLVNGKPTFAWDLPESQIKAELATILKVRALIRMASLEFRSTTVRILNSDQKTVARLVLEETALPDDQEGSELSTRVWLKPVRGYPGRFRRARRRLERAGYTITTLEDDLVTASEAFGRRPGSYSSRIDVHLEPDMRSDAATKKVLAFLLGVMKQNEQGIRDDIDTEFLHDFRVAVRRTRSALGQVKNVFSPETTDRFKQVFAEIGDFTNELRDLDVYLLNEEAYLDMLPEALRADIAPLFKHLRKKRSLALRHVIRNLDSESYARNLTAWEAFLAEPVPDAPLATNAERPIMELASLRIHKWYRKIIKARNSALDGAQDETLHALRIECKKLRYLLEFFYSLYPPSETSTLIDQLKGLQDNLGDFNDLSVQQDYLLNIVEELPLSDPQTPSTLVAVGTLVGVLDQKKQRVRDAFADTFSGFSSQSNQKLFRELFAQPRRNAQR